MEKYLKSILKKVNNHIDSTDVSNLTLSKEECDTLAKYFEISEEHSNEEVIKALKFFESGLDFENINIQDEINNGVALDDLSEVEIEFIKLALENYNEKKVD